MGHHLDRRAADLIAKGTASKDASLDDLLNTKALAHWLGCSVQFLEIARHRGHGPEYIRLSPTMVRYRRGDVLKWLESRRRQGTNEYKPTGTTASGTTSRDNE